MTRKTERVDKEPSLYKKSARGVFWHGGAQVATQLMHLGVRLLLARLLMPADFGLVAMAMVVISFTWWFLDMGFGDALVQRTELTPEHKATAFWSNIILGFIVFGALALAAPFVAGFFRTPGLTLVFIALSLGVVVRSPERTIASLFRRELDYKTLALIRLTSIIAGSAVGVGMALGGYGVYALVGEALVTGSAASIILLLKTRWWPRFKIDRDAFRELWSFGKPLIGARLIHYFQRNLAILLISKFLGATALGLYSLGYQFSLLPLMYITRSVNEVLLATLSKIQSEDKRFRSAYLRTIQLVAFMAFPIVALLSLVAPPLVVPVLGAKWAGSVPLIPYFSSIGAVHSIMGSLAVSLQARGRTDALLRWVFIGFLLNGTAYIVGLRWGIFGVTVAYLVATIAAIPFHLYYQSRILGVTAGVFARSLLPPAACTGLLFFVWYASGLFLDGTDLFLTPFMRAALSGGVYLLVSLKVSPEVRESLGRFNIITPREEGAKR